MASSAEIPSPQVPRKPGKATRLTSSMKPGLYHDCFVAPYTQYTQSLNQLGPKMSTTPEVEGGNAGYVRQRGEHFFIVRMDPVLMYGPSEDHTIRSVHIVAL